MKTIEVTKTEGAALDWLVAKCEGIPVGPRGYAPSTDWSQGGPIIEREKMSLSQFNTKTSELLWSASAFYVRRWAWGTTPLIAAMRCLVVSKMGDTADVPEELL
jgi:hypothetical protein